ncbi:MAG: dTDP-glucose 4,6-dehydratase, partial [Thermoleophilaceae bacterium]|nr:dTDP-glucose 4,6-dehydratase [Thermoleophilaceae bacterium]
MRLLVTGAAGFIGSAYVRHVLGDREDEVVVLDKLTYAGRRENLADVDDRIEFVEGAIDDRELVNEVLPGCEAVLNFAAESHV